MDTTDPTVPLLRPIVVGPASPAASAPLTGLQRLMLRIFSVVRILRGLLFIVYPALGLSSFDLPQSGATFLLGSLLGGRDVLLGGLLATADRSQRREVRRALVPNLLADAIDTFILIFGAACSWHLRAPIVEIATVAAMALLEHLTLWSMDEEDEGDGSKGYQAMLRASEDKKVRLETWLTELRRVEDSRSVSSGGEEAQQRQGSVML